MAGQFSPNPSFLCCIIPLLIQSIALWTFYRKALWQRVYSAVIPILSEVIAYVDRDGNLELACNDLNWISRFWLAVLQSVSVTVMHYDWFLSPKEKVIRERVQMTTSGYARHSFQCQFPFSWIVKERIDSIWRDASNISGTVNAQYL